MLNLISEVLQTVDVGRQSVGLVGDLEGTVSVRQLLSDCRSQTVGPSAAYSVIPSGGVDGARELIASMSAGDVVVLSSDGQPLPPIEQLPPDTALVLPTSGTTGSPRLVCFTQVQLLTGYLLTSEMQRRVSGLAPAMPPDWTSRSAVLKEVRERSDLYGASTACLQPLQTVAGISALIRCIFNDGVLMLVSDCHSVRQLEQAVEEGQCINLSCTPLWAAKLARGSATLPSLVHIGVGGGRVHPDVLKKLEERVDARVTVGYGLTESGGVVSTSGLDDPLTVRHSSIGFEVPWVETRISESADDGVGLLQVKTPAAASGFIEHNRVVTLGNDWLTTGDLASRRQDGALTHHGRADDMISRGGLRIDPLKVEDVAESHTHVEFSLAVGVENRRLGTEDIVLGVATDDALLSDQEIRTWIATRAGTSLTPRQIIRLSSATEYCDALGKKRRAAFRRAISA